MRKNPYKLPTPAIMWTLEFGTDMVLLMMIQHQCIMLSDTLKNVLLVDDDVDHLSICSLILQRRNYAVRILYGCKNMDDLIGVVREFRPGVIFMDHNMPGIGGMDATRELKTNPLSKSIPVIYFSGQDDVAELAAAAGADGFLRKHFYMPALLELTARYIA